MYITDVNCKCNHVMKNLRTIKTCTKYNCMGMPCILGRNKFYELSHTTLQVKKEKANLSFIVNF